jgi:hypothetical protein
MSGIPLYSTYKYSYTLPANLNDSDISPDMTEAPPIHDGPTDMICVIIRYEFGKFLLGAGSQLHLPTTSLAEKEQIIDDLESFLEDKYLKYCDKAIALHEMAEMGARSGIAKLRLNAHHPGQYPDKGKSLSQAEHDYLFQRSLEMAAMHVKGHTDSRFQGYVWHFGDMQLDAFVFLLLELRYQPPTAPSTERAWYLIAENFKYRPGLLDLENDSELYSSVRQLVLRAWSLRETEATRQGLGPLQPSPLVLKLQEKGLRHVPGVDNTTSAPVHTAPQVIDASAPARVLDVDTVMDSTSFESQIVDANPFLGYDGLEWDWEFWDGLLRTQ